MMFFVVAVSLFLIFLVMEYSIYRFCFGAFRPKWEGEKVEYYAPVGDAYTPYKEVIEKGIRNVMDAKEFELVETVSVDGLKLKGRFLTHNQAYYLQEVM